MNIKKSNPIGLNIAQNGFFGRLGTKHSMSKGKPIGEAELKPGQIAINRNLFKNNKNQKVVRVSKSVMEASKLIDIDSIKGSIDEHNFDFSSLFIILDKDSSGVIKVERYGSDFSFIWLFSLDSPERAGSFIYNSYSFVSRSFHLEEDFDCEGHLKEHGVEPVKATDYEQSIFVVQLLTYLMFGDISEKYLRPKQSVGIGRSRFLNNSKLGIVFCDNLWKQRVNLDGFKVRGHFRLQRVGEGRKKTKLIWIDEFEKKGYKRKATVELQ